MTKTMDRPNSMLLGPSSVYKKPSILPGLAKDKFGITSSCSNLFKTCRPKEKRTIEFFNRQKLARQQNAFC